MTDPGATPDLLDTVFGYAPAQIIHVAARLACPTGWTAAR